MTRSLFETIQQYTCLPADQLRTIINLAPTSYKVFYINKQNNRGRRKICQPSKETKMFQYCLLDVFFPQFPIHPAAAGYVKGEKSPLKKNADKHAKFEYSAHFDFTDFFPSIVPYDLERALLRGMSLSKEDIALLNKICFIWNKTGYNLTIGAPISPIISNIVMYEIDAKLSDIAQEFRGVYTRYADDIWFSANKSEYCTEFQARLYEIVEQSKSPNLSINESKTRFYRKGEPRIVTGLVITKEGIVSAPRMKKRYVRSLIHKSSHTRLEIEELKFLKGYLAFLKDNDPDYTRRLFMKYGKTLTNLIVRG